MEEDKLWCCWCIWCLLLLWIINWTTAGILLKLNPIAFIMDQCRNVMIYNKLPDFGWLAIWFVAGCLLSWIGVVVIHKYENSYAKVI